MGIAGVKLLNQDILPYCIQTDITVPSKIYTVRLRATGNCRH
jgi:hypothetical protein